MPKNVYISWKQIHEDIDVLANNIKNIDAIIGVGRGGLIPATLLSYKLNVKVINNFQLQSYDDRDIPEAFKLWQAPEEHFVKTFSGNATILVVDDLCDRGKTLDFIKRYFTHKKVNLRFATLYIKEGTSFIPNLYVRSYSAEEWLNFPWECNNTSCNTDDNQLYFNY
jgi:hypoxanthine phosphoribosyltransferase